MKFWYQKYSFLGFLLWPFSIIYRIIVFSRRLLFKLRIKKTTNFSLPIIIVGNITVGGTGKTPLVAALVSHLKKQGKKVGIVSRGYGGKSKQWPQIVDEKSDPYLVGDEAVLLVQKTKVPMVVGPDRVVAVKKLLDKFNCDMVISDDGLQHYALGRAIEIAVVDGERYLGNQFCLPAGPLRESACRLRSVDFIVVNGELKNKKKNFKNYYSMELKPDNIYQITNPNQLLDIKKLENQKIHAVAGIGNPQRFFKTLRAMNLNVIEHVFPDHYAYQPNDVNFNDDRLVIMTEKDAVKCKAFLSDRHYSLPVSAQVDKSLLEHIPNAIKK